MTPAREHGTVDQWGVGSSPTAVATHKKSRLLAVFFVRGVVGNYGLSVVTYEPHVMPSDKQAAVLLKLLVKGENEGIKIEQNLR
jgi:hypothetical protein